MIPDTDIPPLDSLAAKLVDSLASMKSCVIAFSGGVDSSVVAQAAYLALGDQAIAITGYGAAVSDVDRQWARDVTEFIGIRHEQVLTREITDPNYLRNDSKRCYFCKSHLYSSLVSWAKENGFEQVLSGTNIDDLSDYRPGLEAAKEHSVKAPLVSLNIGKSTVRALARFWGLPVADRPASPCLASRIAYGQSVSEERLKRIEAAEAWLHDAGFYDVRVRLHGDELARVEVSESDFHRLVELKCRGLIDEKLRSMGFQFVTIDLGGRQSGSLNRTLLGSSQSNSDQMNRTEMYQTLPVLSR